MDQTRGIVVPTWAIRSFGRSLRNLISDPGEILPLSDTKINDLHLFLTYWDNVAYPVPKGYEPDGLLDRLQSLEEQGAITPLEIEVEDHADFSIAFGPPVFGTGHSYLVDLCANLQAQFNYEAIWGVGDIYSHRLVKAGSVESSARQDAVTLGVWTKLPVPDVDTPVGKFLKFKEKRRPELLAFRAAMDDMCDVVRVSEFPGTDVVKCSEQLEGALLDIHKVMDEGRIKKIAGSLKSYLSLGELAAGKVLAPAMGALIAPAVAASPMVGAVAGLGLNVALTVASRPDPSVNLPDGLKPFRFPYFVSKILPMPGTAILAMPLRRGGNSRRGTPPLWSF